MNSVVQGGLSERGHSKFCYRQAGNRENIGIVSDKLNPPTYLPLVALVDLLVDSLKLHELVDIVDKGEEDNNDDVACPLTHPSLKFNTSSICSKLSDLPTLVWRNGRQMLKYLSMATISTL